jgi:hypothetical protein
MVDHTGVYPVDRVAGRVQVVDDGLDLDSFGLVTDGKASRVEITAFDDFAYTSTDTLTVITSPLLEDVFGTFDQVIVQAQADQITVGAGPASMSVTLLHSGDGVHWTQKGVPIVEPFPLVLTPQNTVNYIPIGYDDGTAPMLARVRFQITITAATQPVHAHIKLLVTCNDTQEKQFAKAAQIEFKKEHAGLAEYYWLSTDDKVAACNDLLAKAWEQAYAGATTAQPCRNCTGLLHWRWEYDKYGFVELTPTDETPVDAAVAACQTQYGLTSAWIASASEAARESALRLRAGALGIFPIVEPASTASIPC